MKRLFRLLRQAYFISVVFMVIVASLVLELTKHHTLAHWLLGITAVVGILPLIKHVWQEVRAGKYGVNIILPAAVLIAVLLGQYWPAIALIATNNIVERLAGFASRRARRELNELLKHIPKKANQLSKGKTVETSVNNLKIGEKILIKAGEIVPVDSVILDGAAEFDESALVAGALPSAKKPGDKLYSGLVLIDGSVTARVTAPASESQYQQVVRLVKSTANASAPFARLAEFYSLPFTFLCLGIAAAAWILSGQAIRFLDVLVVVSFSPLLAAVPIALSGGLARASREGIIVKGDAVLENLAKARLIAFNKTGTLTKGRPEIDSIKTFAGFKSDEVLRLAASLEQGSDHILAKTIVAAAQAKQLKLIKTKHVKSVPNSGLRATIQGEEVLVGHLEFMQDSAVELPAKLQPELIRQTAVYVAKNNTLIGVIALKDEPKPEARVVLGQLMRQKLKLALITADNLAASQDLAKQLGVTDVRASARPADKIHGVESLRPRPAIFVNNDLADAPALNVANVGVLLGLEGLSSATGSSVDTVIIPRDLGHVSLAIALAKRTFKIARQTVLIGLSLSIIFALVFATGKLSPLLGVFIQFALSIFSIFYALRACR